MPNTRENRFENTLRDLVDCYEHLEEPVSEDEDRARRSLIVLCRVIGASVVSAIEGTHLPGIAPDRG